MQCPALPAQLGAISKILLDSKHTLLQLYSANHFQKASGEVPKHSSPARVSPAVGRLLTPFVSRSTCLHGHQGRERCPLPRIFLGSHIFSSHSGPAFLHLYLIRHLKPCLGMLATLIPKVVMETERPKSLWHLGNSFFPLMKLLCQVKTSAGIVLTEKPG